QHLLAAAGEHDGEAGCHQRQRRRASHTGARAGHHGDLVGCFGHVFLTFLLSLLAFFACFLCLLSLLAFFACFLCLLSLLAFFACFLRLLFCFCFGFVGWTRNVLVRRAQRRRPARAQIVEIGLARLDA